MISRKKKTLYFGLLLVMGSILPIAIYAQNGHAYIIEEAEATHLTNYVDGGLWAEVTLHVTVYIYQGGAMSFFYSESHRQGKPWYSIWYGSNNGAGLSEVSSGVWGASNTRQILYPFGVAAVVTSVRFNENNLNFYYSELIYDNGQEVESALNNLIGGLFENLT